MGRENTPFVLNGYSYADSKATFNGIDLPGLTAFELAISQTKTNNPGMGSNPVSRSRGKKEQTGSLTMDYGTQRILSNMSATGLLIDVLPGILVISLEAFDGTKELVTATGLEFLKDSIAGSDGDENLTTSTDVIFSSYIKSQI